MKPLKPVMAAILAASSFTSPLARIAFADDTSQISDAAAREKAVAHDKLFVAHLVSLIDSNKAVRADVGARLAKFILNREKGRQYLTDGLLDDKKLIVSAVAQAKKWPDANKGDPAKVAALYYVLGMDADKLPAWAPAGYEEEFKPNAEWSKRLADYLSVAKWDAARKVAQSVAADGTTALLDDAAKWAQKILDDTRTKGEVHDSIVSNATTAPIPPTTKSPRNPLDTTGSGFGFDDLYVKGAVVRNVFAPGDDGYRTLSMKVYTSKDDNDNYINKIGIVDITKPDITSPSPTQFIDASKPGDTDVVMHDGGRHYTVTVAADGSVTMKRAGTKDGEGGSISTSKDELSSRRDDQIMSGGIVSIGQPGQPYYVLGQGGQKGSFLFFPQSVMDAMKAQRDAGGHPNLNAHPDLMGDVVQASFDGAQQIKGKPDLGTLPNGDPYHLEFDLATRMWKVVKGQGDVKPVKPDPATPANPANSANAANQANPANSATPPKTLEKAIAAAKAPNDDQTKVWAEDAGNDGFDDATRARIRIMSNSRSDGMTYFKVLFDPSLGVKNAQNESAFEFQAMNKDVPLLRVRGLKQYVALEYGTGTQYYGLQDFANYVQHTIDPSLSYSQAGSYAVSNGQMQDVASADIVEDVLTHYLKAKPGDAMIKTIRDRITQYANGKGFVVNGDLKNALYMGVGEQGRTIWPNDIASGDKNTNEKMTGLRGPGTAVDVTGGQPGKFQKQMGLGSGRVSTLVKAENNAAMYAATEEENVGGKVSEQKVWSFMFEYKKNKLPSRSTALAVFGSGKNRYMLPSNIHMQGLPGLNLPDSTQLMMEYGSNQENGAIAAYRFVMPDAQGGQNARNKPGNCAGPVLWWGSVTKEQAQAACESDSKIK